MQINGINLNVQDQGKGPPVLLLHGFPDSLKLWRFITPDLLQGGYRVISYDQRGFGESDAPSPIRDYRLSTILSDAICVLQQSGIKEKVRVVGHDWGALVGWSLSILHPEMVERFVAISVGHPNSYRSAGLEQKLKSWYVLAFQLRGFAEYAIAKNDFAAVRKMAKDHPECEQWIADLARANRLTAALNWYRANFFEMLAGTFPVCTVPVMGVYSPGDIALTEAQMLNSKRYVEADWRYESIARSGHWIPLDQPAYLSRLLLSWFFEH